MTFEGLKKLFFFWLTRKNKSNDWNIARKINEDFIFRMARIVLPLVCCLVVPCLTLNTALANVTETAVGDSDANEALFVCNARPRYGAIVRKVGEAIFVEGELMVSSRLNHISDMENNIVEVLRLGINVLSHIHLIIIIKIILLSLS